MSKASLGGDTAAILYLAGEAPLSTPIPQGESFQPGAPADAAVREAAHAPTSEPLFVAVATSAPAPDREAAVTLGKESIAVPVTQTAAPSNPTVPPLQAAPSPAKKRWRVPFAERFFADYRTDAPGYLAEWRRGLRGRPAQVFIGFLPDVSKKDAVAFAIGVAQRFSTSLVNSAYAVYKYNTGWAYEVHEGGARRGYLPRILKEFEEQAGGPVSEESLVSIETAQRRVRVERTQGGLTAYLMPESFQGAQTTWLEPGPKLTPAVPLRMGFVAFGAAIFVTGFLTLITTLATRPAPLPLNAAARTAIPYESLPISQWSKLVEVYSRGTAVDSLRWINNRWLIKAAEASSEVAQQNKLSTTVKR